MKLVGSKSSNDPSIARPPDWPFLWPSLSSPLLYLIASQGAREQVISKKKKKSHLVCSLMTFFARHFFYMLISKLWINKKNSNYDKIKNYLVSNPAKTSGRSCIYVFIYLFSNLFHPFLTEICEFGAYRTGVVSGGSWLSLKFSGSLSRCSSWCPS